MNTFQKIINDVIRKRNYNVAQKNKLYLIGRYKFDVLKAWMFT